MNDTGSHFYVFGDFRFDARDKVLSYHATVLPLKPKAAELLGALLHNAGGIVSKDELMKAVWQQTFVEENNLSVNVYELRKTFARFDAATKFIETVPRRGFRFNAPVEIIADEKRNGGQLQPPTEIVDENPAENFAPIPLAPFETVPHRVSAYSRIKGRNGLSASSRRDLIAALLLIVCTGAAAMWLYARKLQTGDFAGMVSAKQPDNGTKSIEARQYYLRGRELWQTRQNPKMEEGLKFFRRAIELDPNFVAPYLGIADSLSMMRDDAEEWRQAEEFVEKALALDPASADARASHAFILSMNKWRWAEAELEFKNALALDENSAKAHQWYANLLLIERRFDEAEAHLKKAIEIEPLSPNLNADLCQLYDFANRYEEARAQCRRTQQINPSFVFANSMAGFHIRQKRYDEAAQEIIEISVRNGATSEQAQQAEWYRAFKKDGFAGWMRVEMAADQNKNAFLLASYSLALHHARFGDREKTLEHLEKCFAGHSFMLPFANSNPEFEFLHGDARFQNLMRRIGLNRN